MPNKPAILAEGLQKHYGKTRALAGLDLFAEEGTVLGLLGPNGAGKTTAVRILTTLLRPTLDEQRLPGSMSSNTPTHSAHASAWRGNMLPSMKTSPDTKTW